VCASSLKLNVQGSAWRQLMIVFKKTHKKRKETNWIWRAILLFFGGISRSHAQNWFQLTAGWCSVPKFWSSLSSARQNFPFWKMRGTIETGIVFCVVASSLLVLVLLLPADKSKWLGSFEGSSCHPSRIDKRPHNTLTTTTTTDVPY
jgi:hypothetical protein